MSRRTKSITVPPSILTPLVAVQLFLCLGWLDIKPWLVLTLVLLALAPSQIKVEYHDDTE